MKVHTSLSATAHRQHPPSILVFSTIVIVSHSGAIQGLELRTDTSVKNSIKPALMEEHLPGG